MEERGGRGREEPREDEPTTEATQRHTHTDREKSMSMNGTKAELIKNKHTWIQSRLCDKNVWNQLTQSCICHAKSQGPRE